MKNLLVIYHSQSGNSARLAQAAVAGARQAGEAQVICRRAWDADTQDLIHCDGLLLVAAENSGTLAGSIKDFLDRTFYPAIDVGVVRPYGLVIGAGNDGRGAVAQAQRILSGYPLVEAVEPLIIRGEVEEAGLAQARDLGQGLMTGIQMGIF